MKYAAVYIPEFPVAIWSGTHSVLRDKAAVVLEGTSPLERVFSRNLSAAGIGIAHGMSKVQAETCGTIHFLKRSLTFEMEVFARIFKVAESFSPRVEAVASPANNYEHQTMPAACILLDRSGTDKLIGTPQQFASKLMTALKANDISANIAVADNAEACILLARSYPGIRYIPEHEIKTQLACLAVSSLRIDDVTLDVFRKWGIRTLGQLAALPESALISRIGQQGIRLQQLAQGVADHLLVIEEPHLSLTAKVELDTPVDLLESLLFIISPMLEQLLRSALDRACALRSVTIELILDKADSHHCRIQPALPSTSRDLLLKLLNLQLQAHPPTSSILGVVLSAEPARPLTAQRGLFQAQFPDPDKLDLLIARLRSIAGQDSVGSPLLVNSYCANDFEITHYKPSATQKETVNSTQLAFRRMRPEVPINVKLHEGAPSALFWEGIQLQVATVTGPWQANGYWWEARHWELDEWDAVIAQPAYTLRLQHKPAHNQWSIAGIYD